MKPKSAYIFVTNKCNLRCKYCYEENRTGDMSPETMIATIDWLVSHYEKEMFTRPFENLTFTFFGGEPLLNFSTVWVGIDYLRTICDKLNFKVGIHILSNGTVLTDEMTEYFKSVRPYNNFNWHFQVSLDGCEETHNANRVFANDEGSYKVISENIKKIRQIFKSVGVRMTVTPDNIKSLSKDFEDEISSLMIELELITSSIEEEVKEGHNKKEKVEWYYLHGDSRSTLSSDIILFSILDNYPNARNISLNRLEIESNSPGMIFLLNKDSLYQKLKELIIKYPEITLSETAGNVVLVLPENLDKWDILQKYYAN